nr:immunoglobulin light chain junction region [Macaca mulatta]MPO10765.1 immunoglobulin light chain junction region [Macaca mulatta]MPO11272.1 immunoglobulin light chain junction region [Macaca mulatta]
CSAWDTSLSVLF